MRLIAPLLMCIWPLSAMGQDSCADLPDRSALIDGLYAELRLAPSPGDAQALSGDLWEIWLDAPDDRAQALLDQGIALNRLGARDEARELFGQLIDYCPDYAEGYNQRAYAAFLSQDYTAALRDLDEALTREPRHLGALTGKALTLIGMGQEEAAQAPLREALRLNRWLSERALLTGPMEEEA
ncbi:hypothetical protein JQU17_09950 [Ponticoccus sp. SC2-23]|uniref:tetratricopeptide repeat protein n=1 Tax=Alexandriicola marinus TaxID=2081710 RepID=UPI000FD83945|nr:hypothetical protein [Alexandriicola marinus]MBM1219988.1 hypothetical protein [Ponticoccus sp. SC6-9]MBM1224674.1 hypothetical protein [Ponticoccus sp. SC6-15]MBM1228187.1 hypothetical protein [Ponticoccus sp. SC6-38]MBM1234175.1 hypothetical protein [Ponticoccus sp. SC6-45]MBM1238689.1 hypothetical protein [Ponticoccus sp. SC6-49]MBM1242470.1 hypothetical protein [Ponticoccus sp. SC2-64]MBM1247699.1 hypothetical protein [Ponticoccus sp. SC6-42]MBM1251642.1 hypothetical protein [Pontico